MVSRSRRTRCFLEEQLEVTPMDTKTTPKPTRDRDRDSPSDEGDKRGEDMRMGMGMGMGMGIGSESEGNVGVGVGLGVGVGWEEATLGYGILYVSSTCKEKVSLDDKLDIQFTKGGGRGVSVIGRVGTWTCSYPEDDEYDEYGYQYGCFGYAPKPKPKPKRFFKAYGTLPTLWTQVLYPLMGDVNLNLNLNDKGKGPAIAATLSVIDAPSRPLQIAESFACSVCIKAKPGLFQTLDDIKKDKRANLSGTFSPAVELIRSSTFLGLKPKKRALIDPSAIWDRSAELLSGRDASTSEAPRGGGGGGEVKSEPNVVVGSQEDNILNEMEDAGDTDYGRKELKKLQLSEGRDLPQASQPEGLTTSLRPYQKQALHWMKQRESMWNE